MTDASPPPRPVPFAELTTLRLGGPARRTVTAQTHDEVIAAVEDGDRRGEPVLVVGGGSNLVVADDGFAGTAVLVRTRGIRAVVADGWVEAEVAAGEVWDELVVRAVAEGWSGVEALSGIPGMVGATPIQNVGAYGAEVGQLIARVRVWDRRARAIRVVAASDCGFGYRTSVFKTDPSARVVLSVVFRLPLDGRSAPVRYAELARRLGVEIGDRAPSARVREAVVELRRSKGMVLDPADHDTWSAGSFFTNPVLTPEQAAALPDDAPRFAADGMVKTSAAWLIEHAGFGRGHGSGTVQLSGKHTLALTNRGGARTEELLALAREVRDGVASRFGITLVNEPVLVGCSL